MSAVLSSERTLQLAGIAGVLGRYAYRYCNELQLHTAIAGVLDEAGYRFEREYVLDAGNRADFFLNGLVIEVKVDGSLSSALRQVDRYSGLDAVQGVLLASTERWADRPLANTAQFRGRPFEMVRLRRQAL